MDSLYQFTFTQRGRCRAKCRILKKLTERGSKWFFCILQVVFHHSQIPSSPALPDGVFLKHKMAKWQTGEMDFLNSKKQLTTGFLLVPSNYFFCLLWTGKSMLSIQNLSKLPCNCSTVTFSLWLVAVTWPFSSPG